MVLIIEVRSNTVDNRRMMEILKYLIKCDFKESVVAEIIFKCIESVENTKINSNKNTDILSLETIMFAVPSQRNTLFEQRHVNKTLIKYTFLFEFSMKRNCVFAMLPVGSLFFEMKCEYGNKSLSILNISKHST